MEDIKNNSNSNISDVTDFKLSKYQTKSFRNNNLIEDFTFDNEQYKKAKPLARAFGNRKFVRAFWFLLIPSLLWGFIGGLVPTLFLILFLSFYNNAKPLWETLNFSAESTLLINAFAVSFLYAAFPVVGDYIGKNDKAKMQEALRWTLYVSMAICVLMFVLQEVYAGGVSYLVIWNKQGTPTQQNLGVLFTRWLAPTCFFYFWLWLYIPNFSSMKNARAVYYSIIIGLIYFLIAYPTYLHCSFNPQLVDYKKASYDASYNVVNGIGGIYFGYYLIQPIVLLIYSFFPREFKVVDAWFVNGWILFFNKVSKGQKYELHSLKRDDYSKIEQWIFMFQTGLKVHINTLKEIFKLSWVILVDEIAVSALIIVFMTYARSFTGVWPAGFHGLTYHGKMAHMAMMMYYYASFSAVTMIGKYMYMIISCWTLLPQYFVATYLGKGDKQTAYHNSLFIINWSYVIGFFLAIFVIIFGISADIMIVFPLKPGDTANSTYILMHHHMQFAVGTYYQVWMLAFEMQLIFAITFIPTTATSALYYIMVAGGSRYVIFADTLVEIIASVILIELHNHNFDNILAYFFFIRFHDILKWLFGLIIVSSRGALRSVSNTPIKTIKLVEDTNLHNMK